jgi:hypothetical protein
MKPFAANTSAPQPTHHVVSPCTISVRMAASVSSFTGRKKAPDDAGAFAVLGRKFRSAARGVHGQQLVAVGQGHGLFGRLRRLSRTVPQRASGNRVENDEAGNDRQQ